MPIFPRGFFSRRSKREHNDVPAGTQGPQEFHASGPSSDFRQSHSGGFDSVWQGYGISPSVQRHIITDFPYSDNFPFPHIGWAALDDSLSHDISGGLPASVLIGFFPDDSHIIPMAFCDSRGNIYTTDERYPSISSSSEPLLSFMKEAEGHFAAGRIEGTGFSGGRDADSSTVYGSHGAVVLRVPGSARSQWVANWLESDGKFTLEQVLSDLPARMAAQLSYQDMAAAAFFGIAFYPLVCNVTPIYGLGDISYRLARQAPLSAVRSIRKDAEQLASDGFRVSGLQAYFIDSLDDAHMFEPVPGLEAVHGKEPAELVSNKNTHLFMMSWAGLDLAPALNAIRLESSINRVRMISDILETNDAMGNRLTEDTVDARHISELDLALLRNPAFGALSSLPVEDYLEASRSEGDGYGYTGGHQDRSDDEDTEDGLPGADVAADPAASADDTSDSMFAFGFTPSDARPPVSPHSSSLPWDRRFLLGDTRDLAETVGSTNAAYELYQLVRSLAPQAGSGTPGPDASPDSHTTEWQYRQLFARIISHLRVPFRYDINFRSNIDSGVAAVAYSAVSSLMMPQHRYDPYTGERIGIPEEEREQLSTQYNLRLGIILAAAAFASSPEIREVSLRLDSLGLEEKLKERTVLAHNIIEKILTSFESLSQQLQNLSQRIEMLSGGSDDDETEKKSNPKDGDVHGRDVGMTVAGQPRGVVNPAGSRGMRSQGGNEDTARSQEEINSIFEQMVHDIDLDTDRTGPSSGSGTGPDAGDTSGLSDPSDTEGTGTGPDTDTGAGFEADFDASLPFPFPVHSVSSTGVNVDSSEDGIMPLTPVAAVTFTRDEFVSLLEQQGLNDPMGFYCHFDAVIDPDEKGRLKEITAPVDIHDERFSPRGAHEEPEVAERDFSHDMAEVMGAADTAGLSIQRADVIHRLSDSISRIARNPHMSSADKAQTVMGYIEATGDPEARAQASAVTSALIDGNDVPPLSLTWVKEFEQARFHSNELIQQGRIAQSVDNQEKAIAELDEHFHAEGTVPRYFNSYADRVIYNHLFATPGERTVLIPDELFDAHFKMADALFLMGQPRKAAEHLNKAVSYAPSYTMAHLRQAVGLALVEDWDSAFAATVNAVTIAQDRDDAAFGYYRMAYAAWMRDEFDVAAAAYILSAQIGPERMEPLGSELEELVRRARSQDIQLPSGEEEAAAVMRDHGLPLWPDPQVLEIVSAAAEVCVDNRLFIPARTLLVSSARMKDTDELSARSQQIQVLRSLNA
ncbi:tetratricopeptide repeat protein [Scardovia wiggsiae]|uniref:tetratricopeptide repeat protein n=1 Tax=Scardovia wiggsiae TaxID=230143 RepID=UPI003BAB6EF0